MNAEKNFCVGDLASESFVVPLKSLGPIRAHKLWHEIHKPRTQQKYKRKHQSAHLRPRNELWRRWEIWARGECKQKFSLAGRNNNYSGGRTPDALSALCILIIGMLTHSKNTHAAKCTQHHTICREIEREVRGEGAKKCVSRYTLIAEQIAECTTAAAVAEALRALLILLHYTALDLRHTHTRACGHFSACTQRRAHQPKSEEGAYWLTPRSWCTL